MNTHVNVEGLAISWKGHDSFRIEHGPHIIYIDPFRLGGEPHDATIIFLTHEHMDHCSPEDIRKIIRPDTVIIATPDCQSKLKGLTFKQLLPVEPGKTYLSPLKFHTVPAYNVNKFRSPGIPFHPKIDGKVGYIIELGDKRIYHAGDTDAVPELWQLSNIDIAFVPVSGTYVMTAHEAAHFVNTIKPKLAIPMHYGEIVGNTNDAETFKSLAKVPVHILNKE